MVYLNSTSSNISLQSLGFYDREEDLYIREYDKGYFTHTPGPENPIKKDEVEIALTVTDYYSQKNRIISEILAEKIADAFRP